MPRAGANRGDERLPRQRRISRRSEIVALMRRGWRSRTRHLDVYDADSPTERPRSGVVVARFGHPVVERNLLKRRIREILRREVLPALHASGQTKDVLVRARREAYVAAYGELRDEMRSWLRTRWPVDS